MGIAILKETALAPAGIQREKKSKGKRETRSVGSLTPLSAREHYENARRLVANCGYHRRDLELEELEKALSVKEK